MLRRAFQTMRARAQSVLFAFESGRRCASIVVVRFHAATGVAGGGFATGRHLAEIEAELAAAGAEDVSMEIVSGVLVGIGFSIGAETVDKAGTRAEEVLWAASLERVGPLEIAVPATV